MSVLSNKKQTIFQAVLVLVAVGAVIAYALLVPSRTESSLYTRLLIGAGAVGMILCAVALYSRARRVTYSRTGVVLISGRVVEPSRRRPAGGKSMLDWAHTVAFWQERPMAADEDSICSICLCGVKDSNSVSSCCKSRFHRPCVEGYWDTVGEIRCPNCRFSRPVEVQSVVV